MGAVRADSRRRRRSPHGVRIRRGCRRSACDLGPCFLARPVGSRRGGAWRVVPSARVRQARAKTGLKGLRRQGTGHARTQIPIRPLAVATTDNALLAPEPAAGRHKRSRTPADITTTKGTPARGGGAHDGRCSGGFTPEATAAARRADAPKLSALPRAPCGFSARRGWRWDSHRPSAGEPFEPDAIDWSGMRALSEWPTNRTEA